jgi:hypothetical protein
MATLVDDGWLWLTDGVDTLKLACVNVTWDILRFPNIDHYEGDFHLGYDLKRKYILVKVNQIIFDTYAKRKTAINTLNTWQDSGLIDLQIQRKSTGAFEEFVGSNTTLPSLMKYGLKNVQKVVNGDREFYIIGKVDFEQKAATTA